MADQPNKRRTIIWLLAVLVLILTVLTTVNLYLLLESRESGDGSAEAAEEDVKVEPQQSIFVKVGPMTVNLDTDGYGHRLLYAGLSLRVRNEETREQLEAHMPEVHSRLLVLLSGHSAAELTAPGGKEKLAKKILTLLDQPLAEGWPPLAVDAVLFTDFIVQ